MTGLQARRFAEAILIGITDGIVAYFSFDCHAGLVNFIYSLFRMVDHYKIWLPWNVMKFTMSMSTMIESANAVFAYCDVDHFQTEIEHLANYDNWEQYVTLSGRIGGVMIADFWKYYDCIEYGKFGNNGFDIGICSGRITALMIDTLF